MKIVNLKTYVMHANWRNYIFLEAVTDDNGIVGYGEATLANNQYGVLGAIQDLRKYVIGRDPWMLRKFGEIRIEAHSGEEVPYLQLPSVLSIRLSGIFWARFQSFHSTRL